jgi:AraC-like DNA-binding protein
MELILIPGIFLAAFLALLIFTSKGKVISDYFLAGLFLIYGATILLSLVEIYNRVNGYPHPGFINVSTPLIFLHGPAIWFYIKSLTDQKFNFKIVYLLHFVPFLIVLSLFSKTIYCLPVEEKIAIDSGNSIRDDLLYPLIITGIFISTQGYYLWGILLIRNFNKRIKGYFSKTENIDLKWLKFLLIAAITSYALISLLYAIDYALGLMPYGVLQITGYIIASIYIIVLGFFGLRQGNLFSSTSVNLDLEKAVEMEYVKKPVEKKDEVFIKKLLDYMKQGKPFLDPELTISKLADDLIVSPEYLSEILNGRLNRNFFDFVNSYRVEEFKSRITDASSDNFSIIGVAWECGFNSKATFNRVFKRVSGMTPGEYKQKVS